MKGLCVIVLTGAAALAAPDVASPPPLFDALPNSCGSNGITDIGEMPSGSAKSDAEITGRFGTPA